MLNIRKYVFLMLVVSIFITKNPAFGWEFAILGGINERFDDNIDPSNETQEFDFITNVMAGLEIAQESRTQNFSLVGHVYQQLYFKNSDFNINSQDLILNFSKEFLEDNTFELNNTFQHYPEPRRFEDSFARVADRSDYYLNTFTTSYNVRLVRSLAANIRYTNEYTKDVNAAIADSRSNSGGLSTSYYWNSANITSITYDYTLTKFETGLSIEEHRGGFRFQHHFTDYLDFTGDIGRQFIKSSIENGYIKTPFYTASINSQMDEQNTIRLIYLKEYSILSRSEDVIDNWRISVDLVREISNRSSITFIFFYGKGISLPSNNITKLTGVSASFAYSFDEDLNGRLSYSFTRNKTETVDVESVEYNRNLVTASITARF